MKIGFIGAGKMAEGILSAMPDKSCVVMAEKCAERAGEMRRRHGVEVTGDVQAPPQTMVKVAGLALPQLLVEIEATAILGGATTRRGPARPHTRSTTRPTCSSPGCARPRSRGTVRPAASSAWISTHASGARRSRIATRPVLVLVCQCSTVRPVTYDVSRATTSMSAEKVPTSQAV